MAIIGYKILVLQINDLINIRRYHKYHLKARKHGIN